MQWVIEHFSDKNGFQHIFKYLKEINQPCQFIDVPNDKSFKPVTEKEIIFFGSQDLGQRLKTLGYRGGLFLGDEKFFSDKILSCPLALNQGEIISLKEFKSYLPQILAKEGKIFVRPNSWEKHFSGQIISFNSWESDLRRMLFYVDSEELMVLWSPVKKINAEYRFHLINNKIVSGSEYQGNEGVREVNPNDFKDFLEQLRPYFPSPFSTIDVADTPEGLKLIEFNPLSTSAVYLSSPEKIVTELLTYFEKK